MADRKPFGAWVNKAIFVWNIFLSGLSVVLLVRLMPYVLEVMELPWSEAICRHRHYGLNWGATWTFNWMGYSKVFELFDTLFLVIKKRPVITLHWYHHITVLVYVWLAHVFARTNVYLVFTVMNAFVHVLMYFYFALTAIRIYFPFPQFLTILQIAQMVVGSYAVYSSGQCPENPLNWWFGMLMYLSYFVLFSKFFLDKYRGPKDGKSKPE